MNNKTLIIVIVLLVIVGGGLLIGGQLIKKDSGKAPITNNNTTSQDQSTESTQMGGSANTGGAPIKEEIVNITLTSSGFDPETTTVKAGSRVIWLNKSGVAASLNSADYPTNKLYPPLNLGEFADGSSVQLIFDKPGEYKYHNHLKQGQNGTVIVE